MVSWGLAMTTHQEVRVVQSRRCAAYAVLLAESQAKAVAVGQAGSSERKTKYLPLVIGCLGIYLRSSQLLPGLKAFL